MRMSSLTSAVLFVFLILDARTVCANGLLYRLPEDGSWARFDMKMEYAKVGEKRVEEAEGTLTLSSVGSETVEEQKCRWIELKGTRDSTPGSDMVCKALLPERYLTKGERPVDHLVRAWVMISGGPAREIKDPENPGIRTLRTFLCGSLDNVVELDEKTVPTKLGTFACKGERGSLSIERGPETIHARYHIRLSDKAPFGVVAVRIEIEVQHGDAGSSKGTLDLKLAEVGKDAKSSLPDKN